MKDLEGRKEGRKEGGLKWIWNVYARGNGGGGGGGWKGV